jgi:hypothetical protein
MQVENPKTKADLQMSGGLYHESNEEFLERTGHLLHGDEPTKALLSPLLPSHLVISNFQTLCSTKLVRSRPQCHVRKRHTARKP